MEEFTVHMTFTPPEGKDPQGSKIDFELMVEALKGRFDAKLKQKAIVKQKPCFQNKREWVVALSGSYFKTNVQQVNEFLHHLRQLFCDEDEEEEGVTIITLTFTSRN